jgi:hypothetical protein
LPGIDGHLVVSSGRRCHDPTLVHVARKFMKPSAYHLEHDLPVFIICREGTPAYEGRGRISSLASVARGQKHHTETRREVVGTGILQSIFHIFYLTCRILHPKRKPWARKRGEQSRSNSPRINLQITRDTYAGSASNGPIRWTQHLSGRNQARQAGLPSDELCYSPSTRQPHSRTITWATECNLQLLVQRRFLRQKYASCRGVPGSRAINRLESRPCDP